MEEEDNNDDPPPPPTKSENQQEQQDTAQTQDTEGDLEAAKRRALAVRAALLGRTRARSPSTNKQPKATSVGERRVGSATQARQGQRATGRLLGAVRKAARVASTVKPPEKDSTKPDGETTFNSGSTRSAANETTHSGKPAKNSQGISKPVIQNTIQDILTKQNNSPTRSAGTVSQSQMGLLGDSLGLIRRSEQRLRPPLPGTVLMYPSPKCPTSTALTDCLKVRVATLLDDVDIATLRLSVFSDFTPQVRRQFCSRSCQALARRRDMGAVCLVATKPRNGSLLATAPEVVLGSVEISSHEFIGTTLGRRRPVDSVLYITEVAVSATARRQGVGSRLLEAVEEFAVIRGAESLYLHVDVDNHAAVKLYKQAGYHRIQSEHPMYLEFTTSLNLHDGATKGRNHFLLCKHLTPRPTWLPDCTTVPNQGTLGFEIPPV